MWYDEQSLQEHQKKAVIKIKPNVNVRSRRDLSVYYTPGIASVSKAIAADKQKIYDYTIKRNTVAVISDGSAVLGLGNIGPEAALPVMEGKALLFSDFAGIDAFPICLKTQDVDEIVETIKNISPVFGGINLEDISAPRCFEVERRLQDLGIPVMHDDQHGTAVVVLAGLTNALKFVGKRIDEVGIVISGAGAAGTAIAKMILSYSEKCAKIIMVDREGALCYNRPNLIPEKAELVKVTDNSICGSLETAIEGADVFIGVSAPGILTGDMVKKMSDNAVIFALANPVPEIDPDIAKKSGAAVVATGRSDYPNQINNVLAFPGIFRGALDAGATRITAGMLHAAAETLADYVQKPAADYIVPQALDKNVAGVVAEAVAKAAKRERVVRQTT
ncbi:MAG: NADP-dependent malic enzyme [Patescibacteria group bacterium]|jgi:malate dehydrogenase (oxaloacetate-decarboxylating)